MKIIKYNLEINKNKLNILVKEEKHNYKNISEEENFANPESIVNMMNSLYRLNKRAEEYMFLVALDTKCNIIGTFEVSHGSVNTSICNPREIFIRLLMIGASAFVLVHNHPSGDCIPSRDDIYTTKRIKEGSQILGLSLLDHIIVGGDIFLSMRKEIGEIFSNKN